MSIKLIKVVSTVSGLLVASGVAADHTENQVNIETITVLGLASTIKCIA